MLPPDLGWDLTKITTRESTCYEVIPAEGPYEGHTPPGLGWWRDSKSDTWVRLAPKTEALILAATAIHLQGINHSNIQEWTYRVEIMNDSGFHFLLFDVRRGQEVPMPIQFHDIESHIGLFVDVEEWDNARFDRYICGVRRLNIEKTIQSLP